MKTKLACVFVALIFILSGCTEYKEDHRAAADPYQTIDTSVYITETGEKYHRISCRYLKDSCIEISLSKAISRGYTPCSVCNP